MQSSKWAIGENRTAVFSPCRKWRYHLQQVWNEEKPNLIWLLLNPSTADETKNDPTVERCEQRARMWGYGGVEVFNIFAYRATNPKDMKSQEDPVGPDNDKWIRKFALKSRETTAIVGWGSHGLHKQRGETVMSIIKNEGGSVHALKVINSGHPSHPLYISYDTKPTLFNFNK